MRFPQHTSPSSPTQGAPQRDPFFPPLEIEAATQAFIDSCVNFMPQQPAETPPSLVGGADSLDKRESMVVLTAAARWMEYYSTQLGLRQAGVRALAAGVKWMLNYTAFTHKGKLAGLTEDQFSLLQERQFRQLSVEAEVTALESLLQQQQAVYKAASRNLTGEIAR